MIYLTSKHIIKINAKVILAYSQGETIGIKDATALDMAINQPAQSVFGRDLYPTIFDKASILTINLATKHPFHNGNKRTAFVSMITFLQANGYTTTFTQQEAVKFILDITTSKKEFDELKRTVSTYLTRSGKVNPK
ncbi:MULTISPECIES: type II toxin-antitoxin system death-on-curing family toxin [Enterococcus]|uniref:Death-on-curing family protein n=1 Tax=Enterococcus mundtii TaxID=53346 RepID=A0A1I4PFM1_ENTMU|nr:MULTISPECIES: type II toxin-antitoxin system death-on-curing family toxin [Enterococcus]GEN17735.1 death-on-curing family protein [Ligilactobacillus acidipiscis]AUB52335.1 prophage maintenance system killer protein [Enterococcus mundtii]MDB7086564.1 type II toxin-antitoxin system death-on-curing family toxin [Enterococcus mundtii]MZZ58113.1 type II toxin-antitoxin system death-on-curing family toxin [Enterococcus mundtii]MZZ61088.1 type II toxin-antitoxin system death-on-curing family toxin